jgi:hypothetical protein
MIETSSHRSGDGKPADRFQHGSEAVLGDLSLGKQAGPVSRFHGPLGWQKSCFCLRIIWRYATIVLGRVGLVFCLIWDCCIDFGTHD